MTTEINKERLSEFCIPTFEWERCSVDSVIVDYAEILIDCDGIKKLEDNLMRCTNPDETEDYMHKDKDGYEYMVAYVHFNAGTDIFDKLFLEVYTAYASDALVVDELLNEEEKQNVIDAALDSIRKARLEQSSIK